MTELLIGLGGGIVGAVLGWHWRTLSNKLLAIVRQEPDDIVWHPRERD